MGVIIRFKSFNHSTCKTVLNLVERQRERMASNTGRTGQQGKSTDSCPEIKELHKNYATNTN